VENKLTISMLEKAMGILMDEAVVPLSNEIAVHENTVVVNARLAMSKDTFIKEFPDTAKELGI
jgi:hypothetical protein